MAQRTRLSIFTALLAASCFSACMKSSGDTFGPPERVRTGNTLYYGGGTEPESIDPGKVYDSSGFGVARNLFEGLMRYDPKTLRPLPGAADRWEVNEEGTRYVFHLREGVKWSDGRPLTAHDFEWSWKRVLNPATAAQYASLLWDIKGGKAYNMGQGSEEDVGVRAIDDRTLVVELDRPIPWFLDLLPFGPFCPVPRWVVEEHDIHWTRPENIVTNGPFHLGRWIPSYQIEMIKSPTYWGADEVRLDSAVVVMSEDPHTIIRLYRTGQLDWIGADVRPPQEYLAHLQGKKDFHSSRDLATYFYWFNLRQDTQAQRDAPFQDVRVRRALHLALDKESITRYVTRGGQRPAAGIVPDVFFDEGYPKPKGAEYDPDEARRLLARAGYGPGGKRFPTIQILYNTLDGHRQVAEAIQQMWKRELGIEVELENQEWKVFLSNTQEGYFQIARAGWTGDFQDPFTFLGMFLSNSDMNKSRWKNAEFDRLIDEALQEQDRDARYAIYARAEQILIDELPILPVYYYSQNTLRGSWVKGYHPNAQDIHPLRDMWLEVD